MARRLAVLAGSGDLAAEVVAAARAAGDAIRVLRLAEGPAFEGVETIAASAADPRAVFGLLAQFGATHVTMAGGVALDGATRARIADATAGQGLSDLSLTGATFEALKQAGIAVLGAHEVAPGLLAADGWIAGPKPSIPLQSAARYALAAAREVGRMDMGQAAVVTATRIVAAEDIAGTDELLRRVGRYRDEGRIGGGGELLVLGKAKKPRQPMFVDLPAIGRETVELAAQAGIVAVVVEAGNSLVIGRERLALAAEARGVSVLGLVADA